MRFYLDECVSYRVLEPIRQVYPKQHEFLDYITEGLKGVKDIPLFDEMKHREVDVFLTIDRAQLRDSAEVNAIRLGGCHWVGFNALSGGGLSQLARNAAMILNTITHIIDEPPSVPTAYRAKAMGREGHQLFSSVTPVVEL